MTTATADTLVPHGTWTADALHSNANFEVEHGGVSTFRGGFKPIDAKLVSGDDGVSLEGGVKVGTISIDDENIRPHLLSPDFFDVERNPEVALPLDRDHRQRRRAHGARRARPGGRLASGRGQGPRPRSGRHRCRREDLRSRSRRRSTAPPTA